MLLEPSPLRIIFVEANVYILAFSSTPNSCFFFIFSIFFSAFVVFLPYAFSVSAIIISIAAIKNPALPAAKSITFESLFTSKSCAIILVIYAGVNTIPISLPSPKAYFKNTLYISPIISKCPAVPSIERKTYS